MKKTKKTIMQRIITLDFKRDLIATGLKEGAIGVDAMPTAIRSLKRTDAALKGRLEQLREAGK